jgi:lipopolysaccharide export system protein LptA
MTKMRLSPLIIALAAIVAVPVLGQALKGHNAKAPVDFTADRMELQDRADRAILSGNVEIRQGDLTLNAARLTVAYAGGGGSSPDIDRIDASGGVLVRSPSETARGDFAVYDLNRRLITMVGGVQLTQGGNRLNGGRLVIDLNTGRAVVDGNAAGGTSGSGATQSSGGRVSGRFTVSERTK